METALNARDVMLTNVPTVTADASVADVIAVLESHDLGGLPVLDNEQKLVGMVTEYDIISKRGLTVGGIMSRGVITVQEFAPVGDLVELMGLHGVRQLPVVQDGQLIGIVTRRELMRHYARTTWICERCGTQEPGLLRPLKCPNCDGTAYRVRGPKS
ncbi:MAG: CBS domain-containing protein [Thermomicrobiales bacterium]|nr:MAG: CBS domain-containing protein [Thermomicrobiales bacterium]